MELTWPPRSVPPSDGTPAGDPAVGDPAAAGLSSPVAGGQTAGGVAAGADIAPVEPGGTSNGHGHLWPVPSPACPPALAGPAGFAGPTGPSGLPAASGPAYYPQVWPPSAPTAPATAAIPKSGLGDANPWWPDEVVPPGQRPARPKPKNLLQRLILKLAALGAVVAKFGALLLKIKYLGAVLSIAVSLIAYSLWFGWSFAAGFIALIFVHEMGHVIELRRQGVRASLPMFIPFLGAFVNMKEAPRSAFHEALSGLAGPYFGTAASLVVAVWGHHSGSQFLLQLGAMGLFLNLFNLLPMLPLDGGRAAAALHPVLWLLGLVGLLAMVMFDFSPVLLLVLVLGAVELWQRWTNRQSRQAKFYYALSAKQRLSIGALYVLVMAVAAAGFDFTYIGRQL